MTPNNLLYRRIMLTVLEAEESEYPKYYSSMYYMRKIAEAFNGEEYSTITLRC